MILSNCSFNIEEHEKAAIVGVNGVGKTTLLSILGTLLPADDGRLLIHGEEVTFTADDDSAARIGHLRNKEIGFVYQDHRLLPQFTVWQNILLPTLATKSTSTKEEQKRATELMEFIGIAALKDSSVTNLSGGEQSRVAICRALINQPAILLADEPTGQLDSVNARMIASLFQQVNTQLHTTIVMATHSAEMAKTAQKTYRLADGKLHIVNEG